MTDSEHRDLLRSLALRDLTGAETEELSALCARDATLSREVAAWRDLHSLLDEERGLREQVTAVGEPSEETDESFARMRKAAAAAEDELRARLLYSRGLPSRKPTTRRRVAALLAAAAVLAAAVWLLRGEGAPGLMDGAPEDQRLGGVPRIVMNPVVSADNPSLSWAAVPGAVSYDVVVLDTGGGTVLEREGEQARSTTWDLSRDQYEELRRSEDLRLRVVARDGAGIAVASSGDLPLVVR